MLKTFIWILVFAFSITPSVSQLHCDCSQVVCKPPTGCTVGVKPDMCNCCQVCAKVEGAICGGVNNVEGECGHGMGCMVRQIRDRRNRMKASVQELIGRCEYIQCHQRLCPFGQICTIVGNRTKCVCPECKSIPREPVCGLENHQEYNNECEVRKEECLTGKRIGFSYGLCKDEQANIIRCEKQSIRIELSKSFLGNKFRKQLSLIDSNCLLEENATHVYKTFKLNECGTKRSFSLTSVTYMNLVRTLEQRNSIIVRRKSFQLPFECEYSIKNYYQSESLSRGFFAESISEKMRSNQLTVRVRDMSGNYKPIPGEISVDINPAERYLAQFRARSLPRRNVIAYPVFCYVTPAPRSQRWMRYILIDKGCPVEEGVEIIDSENPFIKLMIPSIRFRGAKYQGVLVKCTLKACYSDSHVSCQRRLCSNSVGN